MKSKNKPSCKIGIFNNTVNLKIDDDREQFKHYWIVKTKRDDNGSESIIGNSFLNPKVDGVRKTYFYIKDGTYLLQVGLSTSQNTRISFQVQNGVITQL